MVGTFIHAAIDVSSLSWTVRPSPVSIFRFSFIFKIQLETLLTSISISERLGTNGLIIHAVTSAGRSFSFRPRPLRNFAQRVETTSITLCISGSHGFGITSSLGGLRFSSSVAAGLLPSTPDTRIQNLHQGIVSAGTFDHEARAPLRFPSIARPASPPIRGEEDSRAD